MKRGRILALFLLLWMHCVQVPAQIGLTKGAGPPSSEIAEYRWYWDTVGHTAWIQLLSKWEALDVEETVVDMKYCSGYLHLMTTEEEYLSNPMNNILMDLDRFYCGDSISVIWMNDDIVALDEDANTIGLVFEMDDCGFGRSIFEPQYIQGTMAFCLSDFGDVPIDRIYCDDLRGWGMLGTNGKWLIEGRFDQPFRFQNGIAEVIYYGEKRKINERGEFVD